MQCTSPNPVVPSVQFGFKQSDEYQKFPKPATLKAFAKVIVVRLDNRLIKTAAGAMIACGLGTSWLGGWGLPFALAGAILWGLSTLASAINSGVDANKNKADVGVAVFDSLAESVGYGVVGVPLLAAMSLYLLGKGIYDAVSESGSTSAQPLNTGDDSHTGDGSR